MTLNVLEAVRAEAPEATVVAVGSGEVYGPPARLPVDETAPLRPQNPYAVSKASADLLAGFYADAHGLRVIRARAFNHAGPGQAPTYAIASFAQQVARALDAGEDPVRIVTGNPDTRRDYTDVRDVVRAYRLLAARAEPGIYNVCSGRTASTTELIAALAAAAGVRLEHEVDPALLRPHEVMELRGSYDALRDGDRLGARDPARADAQGRARVVASLASTGPNCCATTRARSTSALVNACGWSAVDLDQRALAAADAHRDHQHGAVAEALELGDLDGIALGVADDDLARHVLVQQPRGGRDSPPGSQRSPGASLLSESSSSEPSTTHISDTSSAPSRRAARRPAVASSSVPVTSARSSPSSASVRAQLGAAADRGGGDAHAVAHVGGGRHLAG